jgi:hypothetical protein
VALIVYENIISWFHICLFPWLEWWISIFIRSHIPAQLVTHGTLQRAFGILYWESLNGNYSHFPILRRKEERSFAFPNHRETRGARHQHHDVMSLMSQYSMQCFGIQNALHCCMALCHVTAPMRNVIVMLCVHVDKRQKASRHCDHLHVDCGRSVPAVSNKIQHLVLGRRVRDDVLDRICLVLIEWFSERDSENSIMWHLLWEWALDTNLIKEWLIALQSYNRIIYSD